MKLCNAIEVTILCGLALVLVVHVQGRRPGPGCHPFSCGHLHNISYPFRQRDDPPSCGVSSYELDCSSGEPAIRINTATYYVASINYTDLSFRVVDANLHGSKNSSCPLLPPSDHLPYLGYQGIPGLPGWRQQLLVLGSKVHWASFVNCSHAVTAASDYFLYLPVDCLSTGSSFVYVSLVVDGMSSSFPPLSVADLEPSCGHLATIPFNGRDMFGNYYYFGFQDFLNLSMTYADFVSLLTGGFDVLFPLEDGSDDAAAGPWTHQWLHLMNKCLKESISLSDPTSAGILDTILELITIDFRFWGCAVGISMDSHVYMVRDPAHVLHWFEEDTLRYVFAPLAVMIFLIHKYWKTRIAIDAVEKFLRLQLMVGPKRYAYTDIIAITSHFRCKLGGGGYGSVYKGELLMGNASVAVKMLNGKSNGCNGEDFISEVATIGRIHHVNVVRLVGFCSEEIGRALVYEYMPRGSLDKYIFSSERSFSWDKLAEIALGIARGINYLHQGCDMQILHFDIKPYNILLDDNFVPKVADFGLAKLYPRDKSFVSDRALRGTIGYMAPELASRSFGVISSKSDVYSFGMLLLEMAGGRKNADPNADSNASQAYYPSWVYDQLLTGHHDQQVLQGGEISSAGGGGAAAAEMHELERKLCLVGLWCIQMRPHDRPTMTEAIEMLEGDVDELQMPPRPFFCDGVGVGDSMPPAVDSYLRFSEMTAISEEDSAIADDDEGASHL